MLTRQRVNRAGPAVACYDGVRSCEALKLRRQENDPWRLALPERVLAARAH